MARRVRYNRADIDSTIRAAKKIISDHPLYVFATAYGFTIWHEAPPGSQRYVIINIDGTTQVSG